MFNIRSQSNEIKDEIITQLNGRVIGLEDKVKELEAAVNHLLIMHEKEGKGKCNKCLCNCIDTSRNISYTGNTSRCSMKNINYGCISTSSIKKGISSISPNKMNISSTKKDSKNVIFNNEIKKQLSLSNNNPILNVNQKQKNTCNTHSTLSTLKERTKNILERYRNSLGKSKKLHISINK